MTLNYNFRRRCLLGENIVSTNNTPPHYTTAIIGFLIHNGRRWTNMNSRELNGNTGEDDTDTSVMAVMT